MLQRLQQKWGLDSTGQTAVVFLVFSLAGMSILPARRWVFHLLQFNDQTPFWLKFVAWLCVVFPTYQVSLLVYGTLLGQFRFFWEKEKKMGRFLLRGLGIRREAAVPAQDGN
ncbi:MAG: hypothetical protein M5U15_14570 [Kiritimatiellae bacterium]|nr:hypothetical protein [Kiritimatiellia bacterium]